MNLTQNAANRAEPFDRGRNGNTLSSTALLGPARKIGSLTMLEWGSVAAYGALSLSSYNFLHGLREPARARQRDTRKELLDLLYPVQQDLENSLKQIGFAHDAPSTPPDSFKALLKELPRIAGVMKSPDQLFFLRLERTLTSVSDHWGYFEKAKNRVDGGGSSASYNVEYLKSTETHLRDKIKDSIPVVKRNYEVNNKIAGGTFIPYLRYRFITWE